MTGVLHPCVPLGRDLRRIVVVLWSRRICVPESVTARSARVRAGEGGRPYRSVVDPAVSPQGLVHVLIVLVAVPADVHKTRRA